MEIKWNNDEKHTQSKREQKKKDGKENKEQILKTEKKMR